MSKNSVQSASSQTNVMCSCGIEFIPQDYYINEKCFLCEETPEQKKRNEWLKNLSDNERNDYIKQLKEDLHDFNMVRL